MKESDRAKAFKRRCNLVGVSGVSLHSYRYAWAERAKTCGYPERFAMENLGTQQQGNVSCVCEEGQGDVALTGGIRTESRTADSVIQKRSPRAQADNYLLAPFLCHPPCPSAVGLQPGRLPFVRRVLLPAIFVSASIPEPHRRPCRAIFRHAPSLSVSPSKKISGPLGAGCPNGFNNPLATRMGISCGERPSLPAASVAVSRSGRFLKFKKRSMSGFMRPP